jgi:hypothetical protein
MSDIAAENINNGANDMANDVSSQVQQTTTFWQSLMNDQLARVESFYAETSKMYDQGLAKAKTATEESSKVLMAWVEYNVQLSRDLQKMSIESVKKSAELFQPKG